MSSADEDRRPEVKVAVVWAPAYELLLSMGCFIDTRHSPYELGPLWSRSVRDQLGAEAAARQSRKSVTRAFKDEGDLLYLLVHVCPGPRDAASFLGWFSQLTAGAAYEALAPCLPESGPRLPRDFVAWRDAALDLLGVWHTSVFRHIDPAILTGLQREADKLQARITNEPPLALIEDVTNGLVIEPSPECDSVTLAPQYHHRPYNNHTAVQGGVLLFYPCDVLPPPPDVPPATLMRLTHALGDESRLRMLRFLANGPRSLTEVARFAGLSQPTVHHHLTQLRAAGLVRIHFVLSSPNRYSLRPHALEQLSNQLGAYLEVPEP